MVECSNFLCLSSNWSFWIYLQENGIPLSFSKLNKMITPRKILLFQYFQVSRGVSDILRTSYVFWQLNNMDKVILQPGQNERKFN